jgi:hypothetical protein
LISLFAMPLGLLFVGLSRDASAYGKINPFPQLGAAVWAVLSIWVTLDGAWIYSLAGPSSDPLGPEGVSLTVLGLVNVIAVLLFLIRSG